MTQSLPLYTAGPTLFLPPHQLNPIGLLLPDGRLAHLAYSHNDTLDVYHFYVYNLNSPSANCVHLGNVFYGASEGYRVRGKHREYRPEIRWMVGMGDGRLLAICEREKTSRMELSAKTRFCVYDPYSKSTQS